MNIDGEEMILLKQKPGGCLVDGLIFLPSSDNKILKIVTSYIEPVKPGTSFYVAIGDEGLHVASFPTDSADSNKAKGTG